MKERKECKKGKEEKEKSEIYICDMKERQQIFLKKSKE